MVDERLRTPQAMATCRGGLEKGPDPLQPNHAQLLEAMSVAVLSVRSVRLLHEGRRFRHVVRHKYALQLRGTDVARNMKLATQMLPAFERDYRRFRRAMAG